MTGKTNLILIGYRGTGKSSVGRMAAEQLGLSFVDADDALEARYRTTIAEIVAAEGWPGFRAKESAVLDDLCKKSGQVIAAGGGAVLDPENVRVMKASGILVWLKASVETIALRIHGDVQTADQRPSLTGKDVLAEIREVLDERLPLYEAAADASVSTDDTDPETVAGRVCEQWKPQAGLTAK